MNWELALGWFTWALLITILLFDGAWTLWQVRSSRAARGRGRSRPYWRRLLWPAIAVLLVGSGLWAVPANPFLGNYANPDRFSDLGAAIAGGAIVGTIILVIESQQEEFRRNEDLRFQLGITRDISGIDLRGRDLTKSYWRGKTAIDADISGAILDRSLLTECDFGGSFLLGVSFVGAALIDARFDGCLLGGANFTGAVLSSASFLGADLSGSSLPLPYHDNANYEGANFTDADLSGADLRGAILLGVEGLTEARNIEYALYDASTIWPEGYTPPP